MNVTGAPVRAPDDSVTVVVVDLTAADAGFANNASPASASAAPTATRTGATNLLAIFFASVVPETAANSAAFPRYLDISLSPKADCHSPMYRLAATIVRSNASAKGPIVTFVAI